MIRIIMGYGMSPVADIRFGSNSDRSWHEFELTLSAISGHRTYGSI